MRTMSFKVFKLNLTKSIQEVRGFGKKKNTLHGPMFIKTKLTDGTNDFLIFDKITVSSSITTENIEAECRNDYDHYFGFRSSYNKKTNRFQLDLSKYGIHSKMRIVSQGDNLVVRSGDVQRVVMLSNLEEGIEEVLRETRNESYTTRSLYLLVQGLLEAYKGVLVG